MLENAKIRLRAELAAVARSAAAGQTAAIAAAGSLPSSSR